MKNANIWVDFFIHMGEQAGLTEIKNCRDVDKWADELQDSFKKHDAKLNKSMKQVCSTCIYSRIKQDKSGTVCVKDIKDIRDMNIDDWCSNYDDKATTWDHLEGKGLDNKGN